jgi:RNA binding exosome subunit
MFHSVELRAYCHATEEEARVEKALRTLSPEGEVEVEKAEGHHGNPILLMTRRLREPEEIAGFWRRVRGAGALPRVLEGLEDRIDEEAVLHLRFDKQRAFAGAIDLARHDDVVVVRAKVAAHPAKRANAVRAARAYLEEV